MLISTNWKKQTWSRENRFLDTYNAKNSCMFCSFISWVLAHKINWFYFLASAFLLSQLSSSSKQELSTKFFWQRNEFLENIYKAVWAPVSMLYCELRTMIPLTHSMLCLSYTLCMGVAWYWCALNMCYCICKMIIIWTSYLQKVPGQVLPYVIHATHSTKLTKIKGIVGQSFTGTLRSVSTCFFILWNLIPPFM